jgi:hypothetical protein
MLLNKITPPVSSVAEKVMGKECSFFLPDMLGVSRRRKSRTGTGAKSGVTYEVGAFISTLLFYVIPLSKAVLH